MKSTGGGGEVEDRAFQGSVAPQYPTTYESDDRWFSLRWKSSILLKGDADLAAKSDQPKAATKKSKDGGKDQDYVKLVKAGSGCEDTNKVEQTAKFSPNGMRNKDLQGSEALQDLKPEVTKDKEDKKETTE
ncbi:hypothetical protein BUALT_Bualt13G0049400 [Buddleja alternifolia]|uniref:Uncharacterized protein n=1 Tax=Buddleja alternifolia TaxID=168488 RepID=A0AAV6WS17_9LAMI|nr:hypothetical protein BUALT_Bualt13G0049400 [Buddleja alternifolia]